MKPVLALDADGVLVDFATPALKFINSRGRHKTMEQVTNWCVFDNDEALEEEYKREVVAQSDFCRNMKAYPGAVEFARAAQEEYTVMIVTTPYDVPHWYEGRRDWMVEKLGLSRKNVCFLSRKEFFEADILVDDKAENIADWAERRWDRREEDTKVVPILMDRPWNRSCVVARHGAMRATSFQHISQILEESGCPPIRGIF